MAYRETENTKAKTEARRVAILAAAVHVITKSGMEGFTTDAVADRAGIAAGLIYKYFPDKTELLSTIHAQWLSHDIASIRAAGEGYQPVPALAAALLALFSGLDQPRVVTAKAGAAFYCHGIRGELVRFIFAANPDIPPKDRSTAAAGILGAFFGMAGLSTGSKVRAPQAALFALQAIGISYSAAHRAIGRAFEEA